MAGLTAEQKQHYDEQGYVFLQGLFDPAELQPLIAEVEDKVGQVAHDYHAAGRLTSLYEEHGFKQRLRKMVEDCDDVYQEIPGGQFCGPALFEILRHPKLVDIAECIVGPEVHCEGRHRLRPKLPNYGPADFRWHEDTRYNASSGLPTPSNSTAWGHMIPAKATRLSPASCRHPRCPNRASGFP